MLSLPTVQSGGTSKTELRSWRLTACQPGTTGETSVEPCGPRGSSPPVAPGSWVPVTVGVGSAVGDAGEVAVAGGVVVSCASVFLSPPETRTTVTAAAAITARAAPMATQTVGLPRPPGG